MSKVSKLA